MKKFDVIDEDLRFRIVKLKDLCEGYVFELIKTGKLSKSDFLHWVENVRDDGFEMGVNFATRPKD
jgi:hypothetical protein